MSKLFKLREWLTIPEAAQYLSVVLGEEVTEADVLRLGLDQHLKLSVNFVNYTIAKKGRIVTWNETKWFRGPPVNHLIKMSNKRTLHSTLGLDLAELLKSFANKKEDTSKEINLVQAKLFPKLEEFIEKVAAYEKNGVKVEVIEKELYSEQLSLKKIADEISGDLSKSEANHITNQHNPIMYRECPDELKELYDKMSLSDRMKEQFHQTCFMSSINIDNERFLNLSNEIEILKGVWDLSMIGNESLDIEYQYQQLTDGPDVTLQGIDGTFVQLSDDKMYQLQESFDDNEFQPGSNAFLKKLKTRIINEDIEEPEAEELLKLHEEARNKFLEECESRPNYCNYYPAGGLPEDSVLVVRTTALREFEQYVASLDDNNTENDKDNISKPESTRKTDNLLCAITAIAIDAYGYDPKALKSTAPQDIADAMNSQGISFDAKTIRNWLKEGAALLPPKRDKN